MTRIQVALSAAMLAKDLVPVLFGDATFAMAFIAASFAFTVAITLMIVDSWRKSKP